MERLDPVKVCQICFEHAKEGEKNYTHYGAICCISCKAFFRRIHRFDLVHTLICKNNDRCDLRLVKRTSCKKCRYTRCLKVGLDPEKVLNEEDRKKYTHPKKNKVSTCSSLESPMVFLAQSIYQDFQQIMASNSSPGYEVIKTLIEGHKATSQWTEDNTNSFLACLKHWKNTAMNFAFQSQMFNSFSKKDQMLLLMNNSDLFVQYIIGSYFAASTGKHQLMIILGSDFPLDYLEVEESNLEKASFAMVNFNSDIVSSKNLRFLISYQSFLDDIEKGFQHSQFFLGFILNFILFNTEGWPQEDMMMLEEYSRISSINHLSNEVFIREASLMEDKEIDLDHLENLVTILNFMKTIVSSKTHPDSVLDSAMFENMPALIEENDWINQLNISFQAACFQVSADSTFVIKHLALLQGAGQLMNELNGLCMNIWAKRFQIFLDLVFENSLSFSHRILIMNRNFPLVVLIKLVQFEFCQESLEDQLKIFASEEIDLSQFGPLALTPPSDMVKALKLPSSFGDKYRDQGNKLALFLKDPYLAILLPMMVFLRDSDVKEANQMHDCVRRLAIKKIMNIIDQKIQDCWWNHPEQELNEFMNGLLNFGGILQSFMNEGMKAARQLEAHG